MAVVIIPAYKPEEILVRLTDQLWAYGCRIVVVDDGSGEEYAPVFNKIRDICVILGHEENRGKGAAIKTALSYIRQEIWGESAIGIMDCDGQHLPADMMKLFECVEQRKEAMVLGVREVGKGMPIRSRVGNTITRTVFQLISKVRVSDTQTGLRAFTTNLLEKMLTVKGERYEYEMNVLMTLAKQGTPILEVPIHTIYLDEKNSNSHFHTIKDSFRIYKDIFKFTLSSLSSFALDYLLFFILLTVLPHTPTGILGANIVARIVSAFYNYCMNCRFVFRTDKNINTAVQYIELAGFILVMNNLILQMLVQWIGLSAYPAKLLTECLLFLMSWLIQNGVIFRRERRKHRRRYAFIEGRVRA